jgi:hypothetical protein
MSISALCAKPIRNVVTAPLIIARITIGFLPNRSATAPQIGEAMVMAIAWVENTSPDNVSALSPEVLFNSLMYNGRKG